jgi:hypothetical protein
MAKLEKRYVVTPEVLREIAPMISSRKETPF